jgi:hypothetical protein
VVRANPGVAGQVGGGHRVRAGEPVAGGQQHPRRIGEQRDDLDVLGRRVRFELADDRDVEFAGGQAPEGGAAVHELVLDDVMLAAKQLGMAGLQDGGAPAER